MELKEAYQEKLDAQLKEWSADLDKLKAKAAGAKADAKIEYAKQLAALNAQRSTAHAKLQDLKKDGGSAWEELKTGTEKAFDELRKGIQNATAKFKD